MVILFLDELSFHPLTRGHTFQLSNPERRELKALKSTQKPSTVLQVAANFLPILSRIVL